MVVLTIPGPGSLQRRWWLEGTDQEALSAAVDILRHELASYDNAYAWWSRVNDVMVAHNWLPTAH